MSNRKKQNVQNQRRARTDAMLYGFSGLCVVVAALVLFVTRKGEAVVHPDPRPNAEQIVTANPDRYGDYPEVKETYKLAANVKSTLDGLFCYCYCKGGGHYSLLDCFRDDHGAGCDICLESAQIAYRMANEGRTLEEIRLTLDQMYAKS
jgi:hypothetical protein